MAGVPEVRGASQLPVLPELIVFGEFELDRERFELRRCGEPVHLERQAFDVLAYLVDAAGRVVTKEELLDNVWGTRFVTESALTTQIKVIRRAVGDDGRQQRHVRTVHRRGYEFVADVERRPTTTHSSADVTGQRSVAAPTPTSTPTPTPRSPLPQLPPDALIGRSGLVDDLDQLLVGRPVVTLVGPGGVGKTRLALEVAHRAAARYSDGVHVVDLTPLAPGDDVAAAVAESLGFGTDVRGVGVADALASADVLVLLDNCEHVIEPAAAFVARLTARRGDPARVLTTSREPLDVPGEVVRRVDPLPTSSRSGPSPAAVLLADRAGIDLDVADLPAIERVAALVDGLPLALELAAGHLQFLSLHDLAAQLARRPDLLAATGGRRRGTRHRSVRSAVEWSWDLLDASEQIAVATLASLPHDWTIDAAAAVVGGDDPMAVLQRLHATSMIVTTMRPDAPARHRLPLGVREVALAARPDVAARTGEHLQRLSTWLIDRLGAASFEDQWISFEHVEVLLAERVNHAAAVDDRLAAGDDVAAAELVAAAAPLFRYGVGVQRGRRWTERLVHAALPDELAARVAIARAEVAYAGGDLDGTHRAAELAASHCARLAEPSPVHVAALVQRCLGRTLREPDACTVPLDEATLLARRLGACRLEAVSLGMAGFARLATDDGVDAALATAALAEEVCADVGWDRYFVATLWGAGHLVAGDPAAAAPHFGLLGTLSDDVGLRHAAAVYRLLEAMCLTEAGDDAVLEPALHTFLREFRRATGHGGRTDAVLALAHRAAVRGDVTTAAELLDAVRGRRLAHQASTLFARRAARLAGVADPSAPTAGPPVSRVRLDAVLDAHLG